MPPSPSRELSPRIAVITVSYGSANELEGFLASVPSASTEKVDTVVADNVPGGDEPVARLAKAHQARYLGLNENVGYGRAVNAAVETLPRNVEWMLVSNPDVRLTEGVLDTLIAAGNESVEIGSVGPKILTQEGAVYPSARTVPSLRTGVGHAIFGNRWVNNPWTRAYRRESANPPEKRDAGWLSGACLLVRRSAFAEIGGFDPGFFMYFEDVDLGYRLGKAGYRVVYEPAATVTHSGGHSTSSESARMIAVHHESARRFLNKKYSGAVLWPVRAVLMLGLKLRSAFMRRTVGHE
jgi:N-acetylglucosaminyl-diphospho-decaprenol L-rhamnosyltransferase